jgi:hypothetical protein
MLIVVKEPDGTRYEQEGTVAFKCVEVRTISDLVMAKRNRVAKIFERRKRR